MDHTRLHSTNLYSPAMTHISCPTGIVNAPVELVWALLTHPERWGDFWDVRITAVDPAGPAVVGQTVFAESGPKFLHLGIQIQFLEIDGLNYKLGLDAQFPFGVVVRENMNCVRMSQEQCRVNYNWGFSFPTGWCGRTLHFLLRRGLNTGPADSLSRLKSEAERLHAASASEASAHG